MKSEGCSNKKPFCHDCVPDCEISNFKRHFHGFDTESHRTGSKEANSLLRKKMVDDAKKTGTLRYVDDDTDDVMEWNLHFSLSMLFF